MPAEGGAKKKTVDVRKSADVKALEEVLKKHPITIILIHADWCGHCKTYKKNVWSKLQELPNRKNGLAAIHHDQLDGTQFADAKIRGYPSVILVGKEKMAEFEDEEGPTNALPTEQANDAALMESLATSAEPSTLTGTLKTMKSNVDTAPVSDNEEESPELSEEAKQSREISAYANKKASPKTNVSASPLVVPDPSKDTLDTQEPSAQMSMEFNKAEGAEPKKGGGGSLYESLLAATRSAAPAAALVAAGAVAVSSLRKSKRKTKRSRRSLRLRSRRRSRSRRA